VVQDSFNSWNNIVNERSFLRINGQHPRNKLSKGWRISATSQERKLGTLSYRCSETSLGNLILPHVTAKAMLPFTESASNGLSMKAMANNVHPKD
jgi:hypothetical protein